MQFSLVGALMVASLVVSCRGRQSSDLKDFESRDYYWAISGGTLLRGSCPDGVLSSRKECIDNVPNLVVGYDFKLVLDKTDSIYADYLAKLQAESDELFNRLKIQDKTIVAAKALVERLTIQMNDLTEQKKQPETTYRIAVSDLDEVAKRRAALQERYNALLKQPSDADIEAVKSRTLSSIAVEDAALVQKDAEVKKAFAVLAPIEKNINDVTTLLTSANDNYATLLKNFNPAGTDNEYDRLQKQLVRFNIDTAKVEINKKMRTEGIPYNVQDSSIYTQGYFGLMALAFEELAAAGIPKHSFEFTSADGRLDVPFGIFVTKGYSERVAYPCLCNTWIEEFPLRSILQYNRPLKELAQKPESMVRSVGRKDDRINFGFGGRDDIRTFTSFRDISYFGQGLYGIDFSATHITFTRGPSAKVGETESGSGLIKFKYISEEPRDQRGPILGVSSIKTLTDNLVTDGSIVYFEKWTKWEKLNPSPVPASFRLHKQTDPNNVLVVQGDSNVLAFKTDPLAYNVNPPGNPVTQIASFNLQGLGTFQDVTALPQKTDRAYAVTSDGRFFVLDMKNNQILNSSQSKILKYAEKVLQVSPTVAVVSSGSGLYFIDVSIDAAPKITKFLPTGGRIRGMRLESGLLATHEIPFVSPPVKVNDSYTIENATTSSGSAQWLRFYNL